MADRKKLTDILNNSEAEAIQRIWDSTQVAADLGPLPPGTYVARVESAEFFTARSGTSGVKLTLVVAEPAEFAARKLWNDLWLTPAAMPATKRDLLKIGVTALEQLDRPIPEGLVIECRVALRRDDDGTERNRVVRFDLLRIEPPKPNPFPPPDGPDPGPDPANVPVDGVPF
jgi:hypothetical protein